jgi:two-component system sensor histidine kinase UhpB
MIGAMREQMKEALGDLRRTVATLRTPLDVDLPLDESLRQLAQSFQEATGLRVQLTLPAELPPLPEAHRLALYRAAQESLTNAQRHAQARNIHLAVTAADARVTLTAADDGQGLPADLNGGFGLKGLQERAALLGGECAVENHAGGGAQVRFVLPLEKKDGRFARPTTDDGRR